MIEKRKPITAQQITTLLSNTSDPYARVRAAAHVVERPLSRLCATRCADFAALEDPEVSRGSQTCVMRFQHVGEEGGR